MTWSKGDKVDRLLQVNHPIQENTNRLRAHLTEEANQIVWTLITLSDDIITRRYEGAMMFTGWMWNDGEIRRTNRISDHKAAAPAGGFKGSAGHTCGCHWALETCDRSLIIFLVNRDIIAEGGALWEWSKGVAEVGGKDDILIPSLRLSMFDETDSHLRNEVTFTFKWCRQFSFCCQKHDRNLTIK